MPPTPEPVGPAVDSPPRPMPHEALQFWEKIIRQHGHKAGDSRYFSKDILRGDAEWVVFGAEYHPPGDRYRWHGLERDTPPSKRWIAFQWTLEGEGQVRVGDRVHPQTAGTAFAVQVPSNHEYRLPSQSAGWKFLFIRIDDPWITDRLGEELDKVDRVFELPLDSRFAAETLHFFQQAFRDEFQDPLDADQATLTWMVNLRRHIRHILHPHDGRMEILKLANEFYEKNKTRSFGVEDFAAVLGVSRVSASIRFQKLTGKTLAAYFLELRLRDAITLLGRGEKLDVIAQETGFSDANHFCKAFKRAYQTTPGRFRSLLGARTPR